MAVSLRLWFLFTAVLVLGICYCAAADCPEFDLVNETEYDRNPSSADDISKRPLGFMFGIAIYDPTSGQKDPCGFLTNLTNRAVEVLVQTRVPGKSICVKDDAKPSKVKCNQGGDFSYCWYAQSDKVTFTFYCVPAEGCDTDTQFWYRLTPSVGDTDDWCNERPGDFPRSLVPRPTGDVGITGTPTTGGAASVLPKTMLLSVLFMFSLLA